MYETRHADGRTKGRINYTVWSEVFACPECAREVVFVEEALDQETKQVRDEFPCPMRSDADEGQPGTALRNAGRPGTETMERRVRFDPS